MYTQVKTDAEIDAMREGGKMLAIVLERLSKYVQSGMSTQDLADFAKKELHSLGGKPAFLGYQGFPDVLCVSVNEQIVHGIPRKTRLIQAGDIVSMDFGVLHKGLVTDAAISVIVEGSSDTRVHKLLKDTERSMYAGIDQLKHGVRVGDIGSAVQAVLDQGNYGIVKDLVGHGVGHHIHEDPNIPNYGKKGSGPVLSAGMTIAIEPMATLGSGKVVMDPDNWTILSQDGSLAAHFEHTILITQTGYEILTQS